MRFLVGLLSVAVLVLTLSLGYIAGKQNLSLFGLAPTPSPSPSSSPSPGVACTLDAKICPDGSSVGRTPPSCEFAPCPTSTPASETEVTAGGVLSFPRYRLTIPSHWTSNKLSNTKDDEKLTLAGDGLTLSILQGGFGGSACLFPGDPDVEGPAGRYSAYVELTTKSGDKLRRTTTENAQKPGFGVCQLTQYGWGAPTLYGSISIQTGANPSAQNLETLDQILSSLTKL